MSDSRSKKRPKTSGFEVPVVAEHIHDAQAPHHNKGHMIYDARVAGLTVDEKNLFHPQRPPRSLPGD